MKTCWCPILLLVAGCCAASAQAERYVTVTAIPGLPSGSATNEVTIGDAEAGEIMSMSTLNTFFYFQKDGTNLVGFKSADVTGQGTIIKGPAKFLLVGQLGTPAYVTVKIMPESYPPDKTLIVAPGTNQVQITLESSTNLVYWSAATNGVYGRPDEARFFRIHLQKLN